MQRPPAMLAPPPQEPESQPANAVLQSKEQCDGVGAPENAARQVPAHGGLNSSAVGRSHGVPSGASSEGAANE